MPRQDKDNFDKEIGQRIARLRTKAGLTQEDLAGESEIDRSFLSELENGHKSASAKTLKKIAEALNTKVSVLIGE